MSLLARLKAAVAEPIPTALPTGDSQEVWGAERTPDDGWRLIGRDESPLEGLLPPGADIPGLLGLAGADVAPVSSGDGEVW